MSFKPSLGKNNSGKHTLEDPFLADRVPELLPSDEENSGGGGAEDEEEPPRIMIRTPFSVGPPPPPPPYPKKKTKSSSDAGGEAVWQKRLRKAHHDKRSVDAASGHLSPRPGHLSPVAEGSQPSNLTSLSHLNGYLSPVSGQVSPFPNPTSPNPSYYTFGNSISFDGSALSNSRTKEQQQQQKIAAARANLSPNSGWDGNYAFEKVASSLSEVSTSVSEFFRRAPQDDNFSLDTPMRTESSLSSEPMSVNDVEEEDYDDDEESESSGVMERKKKRSKRRSRKHRDDYGQGCLILEELGALSIMLEEAIVEVYCSHCNEDVGRSKKSRKKRSKSKSKQRRSV